MGDLGSIPGLGRFPWRRKWEPTLVFLPGESHGWRNLLGYSPRGSKESDTTKQLHFTIEFKGGLDFAVVVQSLSHVCLEVSYLECQNVKSEGNYPVNWLQ